MNDIELEKLSRRYARTMLVLIVCIMVCCWLVGFQKHWYFMYCIGVPFPMMLLAGAFAVVPKYPSRFMLTPVMLAVIVVNVGGFAFYRNDWYVYSRIVLVILCSIAIRYDISSNHVDLERERIMREEAVKNRARQQARLDYDYERLVKGQQQEEMGSREVEPQEPANPSGGSGKRLRDYINRQQGMTRREGV